MNTSEPIRASARLRSASLEDPEESPSVGIIVLTWENYEEARDCLESLQSVSYPNYEVIVVDNGSQDGSFERLREQFDWCRFVRNKRNLGVAKGNNAGIEYALAADLDYVVLLNDDTIVTPDFLTPLVETAEERPNAAVVGGVNYYASTGAVHNAGARFSTALGGRTFLHDEPVTDEPYSVDYIPTCLALVDAELLAKHGGFAEEYYIGMEDVDLAWRARSVGREVLVNPKSKIYHRLGTTSSRSPFSVYHRTRNRLQFASTHLAFPARTAFLTAFLLWTGLSLLWWLLNGHRRTARAALLGGLDYRSGRDFRTYNELA